MNDDILQEILNAIEHLQRQQSAAVEVLMNHLASAEAAIGALSVQVVGGKEAVERVAALRDHMHQKFCEDMNAELSENLEHIDDEET